ncbi:hypothetical protein LJB42_002436 [Komagataella kurtzmanii]|nr:hypothetical protein LJB42_002436 [Komagataella kurtzmanii]
MTKKTNKITNTLSVMQHDAYKLLISKKHPAMALCTLLVPEADRRKLDALTGDTSCQSRTMVLLNVAQTIKEELTKEKKLTTFIGLARQFLNRPTDEKPLKKIITTDDVFGENQPSTELDNYLNFFQKLIGEKAFTTCGLCYSNTENSLFFVDENGGYFSDITDLDYYVETPQSNHQSSTRSQQTYVLRAALGSNCTDLIKECALNAATHNFNKLTERERTSVHETFEDQLAAAIFQVISHIPQKEAPAIPLQAIVPQTLVILQNAYRKRHPINVRIRRIMMTPIEHKQKQNEKSHPPQEFNYMITNARTFMAMTNKKTSRFKLTSSIPEEQQETLGMCFDLFSYYIRNQNGTGLSSANDSEYYAEIESDNLDPVWALLLPSLIAHSPFSGYANDKSTNHDAYYKTLCPPAKAQKYNRIQNYSFKLEAPNGEDNRPSLYELITSCRELMAKYNLGDIREFHRDETARGAYERRKKPHQAAIRHIWIGSYREVKAEGEKFVHTRVAHPDIICRGPLFRMGERSASFKTMAEVEEFLKVRRSSSKRAKKMYKANYPKNWSFLVATGQVNQ